MINNSKGKRVNNSLHEIENTMLKNWPECAQSMSSALLGMLYFHEKFKKVVTDYVGEYNLQEADFSVLVTLRRSPKPYCLSPTDIYKSMLFSSGGLTKVLRRLVESGLIERVENINDKRSRLVKLNARGKQLVETLLPEVHVQQQSLLSGLSKAEVLQLERLLKKALAKHS